MTAPAPETPPEHCEHECVCWMYRENKIPRDEKPCNRNMAGLPSCLSDTRRSRPAGQTPATMIQDGCAYCRISDFCGDCYKDHEAPPCAYQSPAPSADSCTCIDEFHEGNYSTGCGNMFTVMEGTPEENDMKFCPYCGKQLRQSQQHPNRTGA